MLLHLMGYPPLNIELTTFCKHQHLRLKANLNHFWLMTYNAKFIPSVASVLHPLYQLLRKDSRWQWTVKCQEAFDKAKVLVSQSPVLVHYDVNKPIKLYYDASPHGVGGLFDAYCGWSRMTSGICITYSVSGRAELCPD